MKIMLTNLLIALLAVFLILTPTIIMPVYGQANQSTTSGQEVRRTNTTGGKGTDNERCKTISISAS